VNKRTNNSTDVRFLVLNSISRTGIVYVPREFRFVGLVRRSSQYPRNVRVKENSPNIYRAYAYIFVYTE